ncbi:MAG: hypothetical protein ACREL5_12470 [Gemmatimonadales bacterium]
MHRIAVIGASWRNDHADALSALTIPRDARIERLPAVATAAASDGLVYLATCNRVEVAFVADGSLPLPVARRRIFGVLAGREARPGEAEHTFRLWQGEGAAEHLFLVVSGLDSARVGEHEIAEQARQAVDESRQLGLLNPRLDRLFAEATRVARQVRPIAEAHVGRVSVADVALRRTRERLAETPGRVALVGVSPMTEQCGRALAADGVGVVIANRTANRAMALAETLGAATMALDAFRVDPPAVEVVIVATGAAGPVLSRGDLERLAARAPSGVAPLIVDLAVPANVAPEDAAAADVPRIGMHEIAEEAATDRHRLLLEFGDARAMVDEALTAFRRQTAERLVGPLIAQLRQRYRHTADEGIDRLFRRDLAGLGEVERAAIRRWAETLAARFAHLPSVGLRDLASEAGPGAVAAFFGSTEPALARQLREAADEVELTTGTAPDGDA